MDISIGDNHKAALSNAQQHIQWLQGEQARLETELRYVSRQSQQAQVELIAFLQQAYGFDAQHTAFSLDMERGVIVVPDEVPPAVKTAGE
ncbi:MAG: hypothetical protein ACXWQR_19890 [Ktedonobacterales bacterium]